MKSFSKRVASFAMAAAMVFSLVAVSPADAEAASKYSLSKKSSITAGKTYTYKVKGVSKNQYIKVKMSSGVTVKYGSKKVKYNSTKITGGKTLSLKVKAADKVANYKATLKAIVYNKKNNKRVKGLTTTTKVKCTKLAIKSVEPATLVGSNGYKYIVVNFNKALSKLDASEVSIRDKETNELISIENVKLATNGKSATLTMLGDAATSNNMFVWANTDYVLTVSVKGATAAMDFNFPDVRADYPVVKTDAGKRTITTASGTYTVPTTISVDFQEILGRTVTFWYNKNHEITKLNVAKETVVYDAFGISHTNGTVEFASKTSDAKYTAVSGNSAGTIYPTTYLAATGKNYAAVPADKANIAYAKLVLNPNGTIRTATYETTMSGRVLVASVAGNVVTESKSNSANLKDYTIVKDGKTIAITDIQAGDVVFYNVTDKYAEVYKKTVTGAITAVTDKKVTVAGVQYEYTTSGTSKTDYVEGNETKTVDADYFVSLKKAAKDATLYLDRFGKVAYASGDKGTVATTSREIVLTGDVKAYKAALEYRVKLSGSDGTATAVPEIVLSDLKSIKVETTTYTKNDPTNTNEVKVKSFEEFTFNNSDVLTGFKYKNSSDQVTSETVSAGIADVVVLTLDSTNSKVVGIEFQSTTIYVSTNAAFEKGKSTITGDNNTNYQIVSSTPVYEINKDSAVSKTTYGEYAKKTKESMNGKVLVYVDGGNVAKIVINDKDNDVYGITDTAEVKGVVIARDTLKNELVSLTIVSEGKEVVYTSFTDNAKTAPELGALVTVKYEKSTSKVDRITPVEELTSVSGNKVANGKINDCELASSIVPTIVQKDGDSWKMITYGELSDLVAAKDNALTVMYHTMADKIIDYVVVQ